MFPCLVILVVVEVFPRLTDQMAVVNVNNWFNKWLLVCEKPKNCAYKVVILVVVMCGCMHSWSDDGNTHYKWGVLNPHFLSWDTRQSFSHHSLLGIVYQSQHGSTGNASFCLYFVME